MSCKISRSLDLKHYTKVVVFRFFALEPGSLWPWLVPGLNHRAMCWVFDLDLSAIHYWLGDSLFQWAAVRYQSERPKSDTGVNFTHLFVQSETLAPLQEWRLVMPKTALTMALLLPLSNLRELRLGALMPDAQRDLVCQYCQNQKSLRALKLTQQGVMRERFDWAIKNLF